MGMREKIAEVLRARRVGMVDECGDITDAVMEVVEEEIGNRIAAAIHEDRARTATDHATTRDHLHTENERMVTRVREVEEENQRLREYLSHAVKFSFGTDMASHAEVTRAEQNRPDGDWFFRSWGPTERHSTQEAALDAALARARQLKEDKA